MAEIDARGSGLSRTLIRPALPADLPGVTRLWEQLDDYHRQVGLSFPQAVEAGKAWLASFERTLGRFSFLWVAQSGDQLEGFLLGRLKHTPAYLGGVTVGEISDLYVSENLRGQGVASRLVELALDQFRALHVHSVEVQVMQQNAGGRRFWENQGFQTELVQVRKIMDEESHA